MAINSIFSGVILILVVIGSAYSQTTEFSYQGSLHTSGTPANGSFDFEFRLFDAAAGGGQVGSAAARSNVIVTGGLFSVTLDFGAGAFPGADRWMEVWVRPAGGGGFQQLLPRTKLASSPYAVQSLNAATATVASNAVQLGGVAANQFVLTADPRMTDARTPTPGSPSYIQNRGAVPQEGANFNISGSGIAGALLSANVLNAVSHLNINSVNAFTINGLFSAPGFSLAPSNTFAGAGAGINTAPDPNVGFSQGKENSFFGVRAGITNVTGHRNSFFGSSAGEANTSGIINSFFGLRAGESNTTGDDNSFFGALAGGGNTGGDGNTFLGRNAGYNNANGNDNTALGHSSSVSSDLQFATAIGASSTATVSNSVFLGRPGGEDTVRVPGNLNVTGSTSLNGNLVFASGGVALFSSPITVTSLGSAGSTSICRNASNQLSTCSSSLRYKTNIGRFGPGLNLIRQLNPIKFDWKEGGMHDLGLGAEDVARIEPLLVTYNRSGQVEGVKYDRLGVVLINAVKEQQKQIESQQNQIDEQKQLIREMGGQLQVLRMLVCSQTRKEEICKAKE